MAHADYDGVLQVGCVCAGYMEGDLIAAKERDDAARRKVVAGQISAKGMD